MAGSVTNPSEAFPPAVGITLEYPDGWAPLAGAGVHLAVIREEPPGEFRANVVVTVKRVEASFALGAAVQQLRAKLAGLPEYRQTSAEERTVLGTDGFAAEGEYVHPQAGALTIVTSMAVINRANAVDLVEVSGTCTAARADALLNELRSIIDSARTVKTALMVVPGC
jgi:Probable lipoprotein LpqN